MHCKVSMTNISQTRFTVPRFGFSLLSFSGSNSISFTFLFILIISLVYIPGHMTGNSNSSQV